MLEMAIIIPGITAHFCGEKEIMPPMLFQMNGHIRDTDAVKNAVLYYICFYVIILLLIVICCYAKLMESGFYIVEILLKR